MGIIFKRHYLCHLPKSAHDRPFSRPNRILRFSLLAREPENQSKRCAFRDLRSGMADCQKVCFDEEIIEEGRFQEVAQGKGDYVYQAQQVPMGQGNLVRYEPKKAYRCSTCCQVFWCLAVLALFVALLLWLATSPVFGFSPDKGHADVDQVGHEVAFDCDEGFDAWQKMGCEAAAFDCSGEPSSWDVDHRATCCDKGVKEACGLAAHPYDCDAGVANWKHGWSFGKKKWCCDRFKVSCDHVDHVEHHPAHPVKVVHVVEHVPLHHAHLHYAPAPVHYQTHMDQPYDCAMGVSQWTTSWSTHKKAYCCTKSSVFCGGAGYGGGHVSHVYSGGGHVSHVYSSGYPHYNSGTYYTDGGWSYGGSAYPHVLHGDTYRSHAGYG
eukprot:Skav201088  [mRNA]  locus=scaffold2562:4245:16657:+ [translate_table: standard]